MSQGRPAAGRGAAYTQDVFDPRSSVQGGRSMRGGGRPAPAYSFDIADAFQLGKYVLAGIIVLLVAIFIGRTIYSLTPATYQVQEQEVSLARSTTYQDLVNSGTLDVKKGDLVAVDGSVLEEGGGKDPTVYLDGEAVNLSDCISDAGNITAENGEDEIEPYEATQEITASETKIARDKEAEAEGATSNVFNFYNGVLHVVTKQGQDGIVETRTGATSGKTATVTVQEMEPRVFENLHPVLSDSNKLVALTFDDGPNPEDGGTADILEVLAKYNVKATFFMLGSQAEEYPEMAKKVADAGHQVCSHSYSHASEHYLDKASASDVVDQLTKAREAIAAAVGYEPAYMRPPGGNVDVDAIVAAGTLADGYIGWSVDPHDYDLPGANVIAQNIESQVTPGAIVLLHDGGGDRTQTAEAIDEAIPKLQEQGYTFVTIDELVAAVLAEQDGSSTDNASTDDDTSDADNS